MSLGVSADVLAGDGGKDYAQVTIGTTTINIYESLGHPGRVVVDIDADVDDDVDLLGVTLNDWYVFGGPAVNGSISAWPRTD